MEDRASVQPGPEGWLGLDGDERLFGELAHDTPELFSRRPAKAIHDSVTYEKFLQVQRANGIEDGICLFFIENVVFGERLRWLAQIIGSCVASSNMRATTTRTLWESFVLGDPEEIFGTSLVGTNNVAQFAPFGYRAGRKIGGINRGDGSFCSSHIAGNQRYGILPCSAQGLVSDAFPEPQSASTYRTMGNSDQFLDKFAGSASAFKLLETEKVISASQAQVLICEHFKPLQICSMWAFRPMSTHPSWRLDDGQAVVIYQRDRSTSWAHSMVVIGVVMVATRWYAIVWNSWGNAHKNGDFFVIELSLLDQWLRDAECLSIGDIDLTDNVFPVP